MAATQSQMSTLYQRMTESIGEEAAEVLLDQLPPGGWDQMSTKSDLKDVKSDLKDVKSELKGDLADIKAEMVDLKGLMLAGFADAAVERAKIIKGQARQLYVMVSAIALFSISIWVALYTAVASG